MFKLNRKYILFLIVLDIKYRLLYKDGTKYGVDCHFSLEPVRMSHENYSSLILKKQLSF